MRQNMYCITIATLLLAGCASQPIPQNARDFRTAIKSDSMGTSFETFVVKRPYKEVAVNVRAKTDECLNAQVNHKSCTYTASSKNCNDYSDKYIATVVNGAAKTEVHIQFKREGEGVGMIKLGDQTPPPAKGMYIIVTDFTPVENGKATKVDLYSASAFKAVPNAIKQWAQNTNQGCPTFKGL